MVEIEEIGVSLCRLLVCEIGALLCRFGFLGYAYGSRALQDQAASESALSGLQFHGSSSSMRLLGCPGIRWSLLASHA